MNIAVISNVTGCSWAGSEEVWYRAGLLALEKGHKVLASLHPDLHTADPLNIFQQRGGRVVGWRKNFIDRFQQVEQKIAPNFSDSRLGNPDVILLSCGSLPAITTVPGLMDYLRATKAYLAVLCVFNADSLEMRSRERANVAWLLESSKANIFVADQNRRQAVRQFGVDLERAKVFYGPLREVLAEPLPMPPVNDAVVFSCVARLDLLWKGQDVLLEVLSDSVWTNRPWTLRLYGSGNDKNHIQRLIELFALQSRVSFAGFAAKSHDIWRDSQVMVLPSRGEGTPLATLEAMMCGRPVVTTDVGGNKEVLEEGVTGWIADNSTPESLAKAMERCWAARGQWQRMGVAAHAKAVAIADSQPSLNLLHTLEASVL